MARLCKSGKNGTGKNGRFVPNCPTFLRFLPFPTNFTHFLYTPHNVFLAISHHSPFPHISPHFPPFPPAFPFSPFSFTSAASWLIRLQLMLMTVSGIWYSVSSWAVRRHCRTSVCPIGKWFLGSHQNKWQGVAVSSGMLL